MPKRSAMPPSSTHNPLVPSGSDDFALPKSPWPVKVIPIPFDCSGQLGEPMRSTP